MDHEKRVPHDSSRMSIPELLGGIREQAQLLIQKEVALAKAELTADFKKEAVVVGGLAIAFGGLLLTISLLLVTAVLALAQVMSPWLAGLVVSAFLLAVSLTAGMLGWSARVRAPFARTQKTIQDDFQLTKGNLS